MPSVISLIERIGLRVVGEADLVADGLARRAGRAPARCAPRPRARRCAAAACGRSGRARRVRRARQIFGSCVVLPEPGLAADDDDRMVADRALDLVGALRDRQLGGIGDRRLRRAARARACATERASRSAIRAHSAGGVAAPRARSSRRASARRVGGHGLRQARAKLGVGRDIGMRQAAASPRGHSPWGGGADSTVRLAAFLGIISAVRARLPCAPPNIHLEETPCVTRFHCAPPHARRRDARRPRSACRRSPPTPSRCAGPAAATCRPPTRIRRTKTSPTTSTSWSTSS